MHETKKLPLLIILFVGLFSLANAQCPGFSIKNPGVIDVVCKGDNNGRISIIVDTTGSTTLSAYIIPNLPSSPMQPGVVGGQNVFVDTFNNLSAGTYQVVVGDETLCTDTISVVVEEPQDAFTIAFDSVKNATCFNNGYLSVDVSGGWSTPTVFTWDLVDGMGISLDGDSYPTNRGFEIRNLLAGNYTVAATDERGCKDSVAISITGNPPFEVDLDIVDGSLPLELGDSLDLVATPNSGVNIDYEWFPLVDLSFLGPGRDSVRVKPCEERTYIVKAVDTDRICSATDQITVTIDGEFAPWLPNIFEPSSNIPTDNIFQVFGSGIETVSMEIFDRKGALVYESADSIDIDVWDGSMGNSGQTLVTGKYIYITRIKSICNEVVRKTGSVTLIR